MDLAPHSDVLPFDGPLQDVLRDRAVCNPIQSAHLGGWDTSLLRSAISPLTPHGEVVRYSSIELLLLEHGDIDISDFLVRYHFLKLGNLRLSSNVGISSWDYLKVRSVPLTTLPLEYGVTSSSPTTSQLLSTFASYTNLQNLSLQRRWTEVVMISMMNPRFECHCAA